MILVYITNPDKKTALKVIYHFQTHDNKNLKYYAIAFNIRILILKAIALNIRKSTKI